jgi:hypothetical protein
MLVVVYFQLERKRHIGNDIVNIVFLDGTPEEMAAFSPNCIKSQFTRIQHQIGSIFLSGFILNSFCFRYLRFGHVFTRRGRVSVPHLFGRVGATFRSVASVSSHLPQSARLSRVPASQTYVKNIRR